MPDRENMYDIIDEESGLVINTLTDKFIRKIAKKENTTPLKIKEKLMDAAKKMKKVYFVVSNTGEIIVTFEGAHFKTPGEYFRNYEDAKN